MTRIEPSDRRRSGRPWQGMDCPGFPVRQNQGDFPRTIAEAVLQLIMETDVDGLPDAGGHERSENA